MQVLLVWTSDLGDFDLILSLSNTANFLLKIMMIGLFFTCRWFDRLQGDIHIEGFNLGANVNEVAGQTVPHFHFHIIPRRMSVVKQMEQMSI